MEPRINSRLIALLDGVRATGLAEDGRTARATALVVGDAMLDRYWFGDVSRISPEAPVPVVRIARSEHRLGGAANVARNASALGASVSLLAVVGKDEAAGTLRELLRKEAIATYLHEDAELQTTVKLRVIGRQQQLLRIDFEAYPSHEVLANKLQDFAQLVSGVSVVIFSDYGKGVLERISEMIAIARRAGKMVLVDPKGDDYERYRGATLLTPNLAEIRAVVGGWKDESGFRRKAAALRERLELDALLVTRSEEGMTLFEAGGEFNVPARAREVYDVSGAGDTVIAVAGVMLAAGATLPDAVAIANCAAGVVVGKLGTAVVTLDEIREALE